MSPFLSSFLCFLSPSPFLSILLPKCRFAAHEVRESCQHRFRGHDEAAVGPGGEDHADGRGGGILSPKDARKNHTKKNGTEQVSESGAIQMVWGFGHGGN